MDRIGMQDSMSEKVAVQHYRFSVATPAAAEPEWASLVARWHQLDDATFALVEAAHCFRRDFPQEWKKLQPQSIWLATPGGSNLADAEFVGKGCRSPSRFVGTLPSIRSSSLSLLMDWRGPVLCLQYGKTITAQGLSEVYWHLASSGESCDRPVWLISARHHERDDRKVFDVSFFVCGNDVAADFYLTASTAKIPNADKDVLAWLDRPSPDGKLQKYFSLGADVRMERSES